MSLLSDGLLLAGGILGGLTVYWGRRWHIIQTYKIYTGERKTDDEMKQAMQKSREDQLDAVAPSVTEITLNQKNTNPTTEPIIYEQTIFDEARKQHMEGIDKKQGQKASEANTGVLVDDAYDGASSDSLTNDTTAETTEPIGETETIKNDDSASTYPPLEETGVLDSEDDVSEPPKAEVSETLGSEKALQKETTATQPTHSKESTPPLEQTGVLDDELDASDDHQEATESDSESERIHSSVDDENRLESQSSDSEDCNVDSPSLSDSATDQAPLEQTGILDDTDDDTVDTQHMVADDDVFDAAHAATKQAEDATKYDAHGEQTGVLIPDDQLESLADEVDTGEENSALPITKTAIVTRHYLGSVRLMMANTDKGDEA